MHFSDGPAIICPKRFLTPAVVNRVAQFGLGSDRYVIATEQRVAFRYGSGLDDTCNIDYVFMKPNGHLKSLRYALVEFQSVYFSGQSTKDEYTALRCGKALPPGHRQADWKSSFLKRLLPQILIKAKVAESLGAPLLIIVQKTGWESPPFQEAAIPLNTAEAPGGKATWLVFDLEEGPQLDGRPRFEFRFQEARVVEHRTMLDIAYGDITVSVEQKRKFLDDLSKTPALVRGVGEKK